MDPPVKKNLERILKMTAELGWSGEGYTPPRRKSATGPCGTQLGPVIKSIIGYKGNQRRVTVWSLFNLSRAGIETW